MILLGCGGNARAGNHLAGSNAVYDTEVIVGIRKIRVQVAGFDEVAFSLAKVELISVYHSDVVVDQRREIVEPDIDGMRSPDISDCLPIVIHGRSQIALQVVKAA